MAGSRRRCPRRSGPSTPRCGAGQPRSESPAASCAPFPGLGPPRGCLGTNPGPAGNETTPPAGTLATGQANTRAAAGRLRECRWEEATSYLFSLFLHTPHQQGAGLRGGSLQVISTQMTPHPRSSSYWGCPRLGQLSHSTCWVACTCLLVSLHLGE